MRCRFLLLLFLYSSFSQLAFSQRDTIRLHAGAGFPEGGRFFFKGENHEYPESNARSLFAVLKYLYTHQQVRYLVMECGPDQAFLANNFLTNASFPDASGLYLGKGFWEQVKEFNTALPAGQKIEILGFDFNRYIYTVSAVRLMMQKKSFGGSLDGIVQKVMEWDTVHWNFDNQKRFDKDLMMLKKEIAGNKDLARKVLAEDYDVLQRILNNETPATPHVKRDKQVVKQLLQRLPELQAGNFLFNYGIAHTFLDGVGAAKLLSEEKEVPGGICSIFPFYVLPDTKKTKVQQKIDNDLPADFRSVLTGIDGNTLISLEKEGIYPRRFKKSQWVLIIKDAE